MRERDEARLIAERQRGFIFELESEQRQARSKLEQAERERDALHSALVMHDRLADEVYDNLRAAVDLGDKQLAETTAQAAALKASLEKQIKGRQEACMWAQDASSHIVKLEGERDEARAKLESWERAARLSMGQIPPKPLVTPTGHCAGCMGWHPHREDSDCVVGVALAACRKEDK